MNLTNNVTRNRKESLLKHLAKAFINPFNILLCGLAVILAFMGEADPAILIFILLIALVYGILRIEQVPLETRNSHAKLQCENDLSK